MKKSESWRPEALRGPNPHALYQIGVASILMKVQDGSWENALPQDIIEQISSIIGEPEEITEQMMNPKPFQCNLSSPWPWKDNHVAPAERHCFCRGCHSPTSTSLLAGEGSLPLSFPPFGDPMKIRHVYKANRATTATVKKMGGSSTDRRIAIV